MIIKSNIKMIEKTKKESKKELEVDLSELSDWSGEYNVRRYRFIVPILKFNGNTAKWHLLIPDVDGNWIPREINDDIEIVILKVRRVLTSYEKLPDGSGLRRFTNEHNNWKDPLTLFEIRKGDAKPKMVDAGTIKDLRQRWPKLKLRQNIYCLLGNQIVKLAVRGKSLSSLYAYYDVFKANEHIFQFWTKLSCHSETNEGGLTYYVIDWIKGSPADLSIVAEKLKEVKESLELQDKQYAEFGAKEDIPIEISTEELEKPEVEDPIIDIEEVEIKDLP